MMDNPISWGILVILAIILLIWFIKKCEDEISRNQRENENYFWEVEHGYREK